MQLLFEKSKKGKQGITLPKLDVPKVDNLIPSEYLRDELSLPELNEVLIMDFTLWEAVQ